MSERRVYWALFVLLAAATILPIWIARYLPLLDLPNHLAAITVWHYHDDPAWNFAQYYDLNLVPLPYWAHYYTVHLLTYVTRSVELANKIFLSGYALAVPLGARLLARRFGRSEWLAWLTFPLVWNFNLCDGFVAYCAGFAALLSALALVDVHYERPRWWTALAVTLSGSLIYFFHLLPYALYLVLASLLVLVQRRPLAPRLLAARWLPVLACALVGLWALRHGNTMGFHHVTGDGYEMVHEPVDVNLFYLWERIFNFLPGQLDDWLTVLLMLTCLALVVTGMRQPPDAEEPRGGRLHSWGLELCLAATLVLYFVLPRSMRKPFYWHMINGRFVVEAALFVLLAVRGRIDGWRRWLLAPALALSVAYPLAIAGAFVTFNRNAAGLDQLVAQIPRDKTVLTLMLHPVGDPEIIPNAFNQFPSYVQLLHGGYNFYNFADGFPLKYKLKLPAPGWSHADHFKFASHSKGWDYFLTFREGWETRVMDEPQAEGKVKLVGAAGAWRLYRKVVNDRPLGGNDEP